MQASHTGDEQKPQPPRPMNYLSKLRRRDERRVNKEIKMTKSETVPAYDAIEKDILVGETYIPLYQRHNLNRSTIQQIKDGLDWERFGRPIVWLNPDTNRYEIIDGQHRCVAIKEMYGEYTAIPVIVSAKAVYVDRAKLFVKQQTARTPVTAIELFLAEVQAADETAIKINEIVRKNGAMIAGSGGGAPASHIAAIGSVRSAYSYGPEILDRTLAVCRKVWPEDKKRHSSINMLSIAKFLRAYPSADDERLVKALNRMSDKQGGSVAIQRAITLRHGFSGSGIKGSATSVGAAAVCNEYNLRLRGELRFNPEVFLKGA